jgi:hypothetical protein
VVGDFNGDGKPDIADADHGSRTVSVLINVSAALPTSMDQCMNGDWKNFGSTFKNQGDCVSFVATGGKNPAG